MKKYGFIIGVAGCLVGMAIGFVSISPGEAGAKQPAMGSRLGRLAGGQEVYGFRTPEGHACIYVSDYKAGGLDCNFK